MAPTLSAETGRRGFCVLCPQLNLLNLQPPNKIPGYATGEQESENAGIEEVL